MGIVKRSFNMTFAIKKIHHVAYRC
ncbi:VOC family protein, partial [Pseudomonas aeruginosa]